MQESEIRRLLPWRQPFAMIDRMIECRPHDSIVTLKNVTAGDSMFDGAEGAGAFPAMMLLEGLSQSAALLFRLSYDDVAMSELPLLGFLEASLTEQGAAAGDSIVFTVRSVKMTRGGGIFQGTATVGERTLIAEAELGFSSSNTGPRSEDATE